MIVLSGAAKTNLAIGPGTYSALGDAVPSTQFPSILAYAPP
jgi:hypothetical protein